MGKLSDQDKIDIVNEYILNVNTNCLKLSIKYNVSPHSIGSLLKRRGVKVRKIQGYCKEERTLNHDFFQKIDTEEKAYFLGLLYADGCNNGKIIDIGLSEIDVDILNKFLKAISANFQKTYNSSIKKRNPKQSNQYRVRFTSVKMASDLSKLGCIPRKTCVLKFPTEEQVPTHLMRHFVRGYFDGDGNIGKYKREQKGRYYYRVSSAIASSHDFCEGYKKYLKRALNIECCLYKRKNYAEVTINNNSNCKIFLDWIYKDCTVAMNRKHNKYKNMNYDYSSPLGC